MPVHFGINAYLGSLLIEYDFGSPVDRYAKAGLSPTAE